MSTLPLKNKLGFYEIRLESIGGLGANLAGRMLAEATVLGQGLNGTSFSSYGSEKKGSPVKCFIRFSDPEVEIRAHSPVEFPHVIGIFHEALYKTVDVLQGLRPEGMVLVNSVRDMEKIASDLKLHNNTLAVVDAMGIAVEEKTRVNTAMLGALYRICDFLNPDDMRNMIKETFSKKYPHLVESNIRTFDRGYSEVQLMKIQSREVTDQQNDISSILPRLGYDTQVIGGVIPTQANSLKKEQSGSRQGFIPQLDLDLCIHCSACDTACPDFCFVWRKELDRRGRMRVMLKGIDYQYCKGCLKCVSACPTNALTVGREKMGYAEDHRTPQHHPFVTGGTQHV